MRGVIVLRLACLFFLTSQPFRKDFKGLPSATPVGALNSIWSTPTRKSFSIGAQLLPTFLTLPRVLLACWCFKKCALRISLELRPLNGEVRETSSGSALCCEQCCVCRLPSARFTMGCKIQVSKGSPAVMTFLPPDLWPSVLSRK